MRKRTAFPLALGVLGAATLAYAAGYERTRWTLREYEVPVLDRDAPPIRILQISDLHMLPGQRSKQDWVRTLDELEPDFVALTGDNLASPDAVPAVLEALGPLLDRPGAFVFGSNDYYGPVLKSPFTYFRKHRRRRIGVDLPWTDLRDGLLKAGWTDVNNARTTVPLGNRHIELSGVDDPHLYLDDYDSIAGPGDRTVDLRLGFTHSPEPRILDRFAADNVDLVLAGHTHGGQVCVPGYGALVTNCELDRSLVKGAHRYTSSTWLHVSAGMGTSPYAPVRFACPPEVTLLTLVPNPGR